MSDQKKIDDLIANARQGKLDEVKKLLGEGVDINSKEPRGYSRTALHVATEFGKIDMMKYLIDNEAELRVTDSGSYNPLMSVVQKIDMGDGELYRLSKTKKRYINQDENGKYITGFWADEDRPDKLKEQQDAIIRINELQEKRIEAIKILIEKAKAKENNILNDILRQGDMHGLNAIQLSYRGRYEIIQILLDNGADPKDILHKTYFAETVDENVLILLMEYAIRDPNYEPGEDAHPRVEFMYNHYRHRREEMHKIIDNDDDKNNIADKNKLPENVSKEIQSFIDGSGKRKSRKSKKANKTVKKRKIKRNNKSKK
jgi:ankyrin repeat protein